MKPDVVSTSFRALALICAVGLALTPTVGLAASSQAADKLTPVLDDTPPVDATPPEITATVTCAVPGNPPWCRGGSGISWVVIDPESEVLTASGCEYVFFTGDTPLNGLTFTCTAQSQGGSSAQSVTIYQDHTYPNFAFPDFRYWYFRDEVVIPSFTCTDVGSGFASSGTFETQGPNAVDCTGPATFDTSTAGIHGYGEEHAIDIAGNHAAHFGVFYRVIDDPDGSFPYIFPHDSQVVAGKAIAVRFTLNGNRGLDIFDPASPALQPVACDSGETVGAPQPLPASRYDLVYKSNVDTYVLALKTSSEWAGTCQTLQLGFTDGTYRQVNFTFQ